MKNILKNLHPTCVTLIVVVEISLQLHQSCMCVQHIFLLVQLLIKHASIAD
jgi:hypothetical protein